MHQLADRVIDAPHEDRNQRLLGAEQLPLGNQHLLVPSAHLPVLALRFSGHNWWLTF